MLQRLERRAGRRVLSSSLWELGTGKPYTWQRPAKQAQQKLETAPFSPANVSLTPSAGRALQHAK